MLVSYRCVRRSQVTPLPRGVTFADRKAPEFYVWVRIEDGAAIPPPKLRAVKVQLRAVEVRIAPNLLGVFTAIAGSDPTSVWPTRTPEVVAHYRVPRDRAHALTTTARLL